MTPQEQQLLQDLTAKINQTVLQDKDPEAAQLLTGSLGRNPDAIYIMAQTILVQNYALGQAKQQLDQANQQLDQLKQQAQQQPPKHSSFLGNLLGINDSPAAPPPPAAAYAPPPNYGPPQYAQPMYAQPPYVQNQPGMQGGGFLHSALQTATGVAAGALAFEGIESLMHGFGNHAGYGDTGFGGFAGGGQPREEIVNNYYGDSGQRENHADTFGDRLAQTDGGSATSPDLEDRRNDSSSFADSDDSVTDNDDSDNYSDDSGSNDSDSANFDPTGDDSSF